MLKPGLGKGLGDLMHGDQITGKKSPPTGRTDPAPELGRGLQTLVQREVSEPLESHPPKPPLIPVWFYFAADLLLLAYAVAITFDAPRPFDLGTILFCAISITLGALLAILGLFQTTKTD